MEKVSVSEKIQATDTKMDISQEKSTGSTKENYDEKIKNMQMELDKANNKLKEIGKSMRCYMCGFNNQCKVITCGHLACTECLIKTAGTCIKCKITVVDISCTAVREVSDVLLEKKSIDKKTSPEYGYDRALRASYYAQMELVKYSSILLSREITNPLDGMGFLAKIQFTGNVLKSVFNSFANAMEKLGFRIIVTPESGYMIVIRGDRLMPPEMKEGKLILIVEMDNACKYAIEKCIHPPAPRSPVVQSDQSKIQDVKK